MRENLENGSRLLSKVTIKNGIFALIKKWWKPGGLVLSVMILSAVITRFSLPSPLFDSPLSTVLFDKDGVLLSASTALDQQWRFPPSGEIPYKFRKSVINFEDKRFYLHLGVDPAALFRAAILDLRAKKIVSGGSTISMQVIRLSRPGKSRTIFEKIIEMTLAFGLELSYSKKEILSLYASYAPFGGNVVGLEAASWRYFGCSPGKLSWSESACLAVLPNAPSLVRPGKNRGILLRKRDALLKLLYKRGVVDSSTCSLALKEPLPSEPFPLPRLAPHLLDRVVVERRMTKNKKVDVGSRVNTTLIASLQTAVSGLVDKHISNLSGNEIHNAAALILDVPTGNVLAYVGNVSGSAGTDKCQAVDIITAPRSTGSILKPFLYAAKLQSGEMLPDQLVPDIPMRIGGFAPENFNRSFDGAVPASAALARSLNVPAVWMLQDYGVDRFYALLKSIGMTTLNRKGEDYGLTLILGGAEGTLWDITGMYAGLARCVTSYFNNDDDLTFFPPHFTNIGTEPDSKKQRSSSVIIGAGTAWLTLKALLEVRRPEEESAWEYYSSSRRISWKTGTSIGFRDAWAVGVTPNYAVGVWVGNADGEGRPGLTGSSVAAPLLFQCFDLLINSDWFECPESDLMKFEVCTKSGCRASPICVEKKEEYAPLAAQKSGMCPYCIPVHCDSSAEWRVHGNCEPVDKILNISWFVLPPAIEWYYRKHHFEYRPLPPYRADCSDEVEGKTDQSIGLIYPRTEDNIYIPIDIDGKRSKTVFEAVHRRADAVIYWHLDDRYLGATVDIHHMECAPSQGRHSLTLVDDRGERLERRFNILEAKRQINTKSKP